MEPVDASADRKEIIVKCIIFAVYVICKLFFIDETCKIGLCYICKWFNTGDTSHKMSLREFHGREAKTVKKDKFVMKNSVL
jgi:hypothetical protein